MNTSLKARIFVITLAFASLPARPSSAEVPVAIDAPDETIATTVHAEGAQIYECKADSGGKLSWQAREPIATLVLDGKTIGRHFAGPNWEHIDGSAVRARMVSNAPGSTASDIPWLKLEVTNSLGHGAFTGVTTIQRINTRGGMAQGLCETAGGFLSVPYHADYVFLRPVE